VIINVDAFDTVIIGKESNIFDYGFEKENLLLITFADKLTDSELLLMSPDEDTLDKIKAFNPDIPVVMLSSQDKIDVAINCMHHRAFDYVVKSETAFVRLQKIITTIFRYKKMEKELNWYMERM